MQCFLKLGILPVLLLGLTACGNKGDLYLPSRDKPAQQEKTSQQAEDKQQPVAIVRRLEQ